MLHRIAMLQDCSKFLINRTRVSLLDICKNTPPVYCSTVLYPALPHDTIKFSNFVKQTYDGNASKIFFFSKIIYFFTDFRV